MRLAVRLLGRVTGPGLLLFATRARLRFIPVLVVITLVLGVAALVTGQVSLMLGGLLVGVVCSALWAER